MPNGSGDTKVRLLLKRGHDSVIVGNNCSISDKSKYGTDIKIGHNVIIEDGVTLGSNIFIDSNSIIRGGTNIADGCSIGANCIVGEYQMDFYLDKKYHEHPLLIGENAIIRSGSILYSGSEIGRNFQTGHRVTIREKTTIGDNCSIGTLSDVQGHCKLGDYVRLHSNVHIGKSSVVDNFVWIYPYVVLTNDPTPPSDIEIGVHVHSFAIIATSSTILPGIDIASDSLVAAGSTVTRDVKEFNVVAGSPAKVIADLRDVKSRENGEDYYPWRYHFSRNMPWSGQNFDSWVASLTKEEKDHYSL